MAFQREIEERESDERRAAEGAWRLTSHSLFSRIIMPAVFFFPFRILGCPLLLSYARQERKARVPVFNRAFAETRPGGTSRWRTYCAIYIPLLRPHLAPSVRLRESYLTSGSHKCSSCMSGARRLLRTPDRRCYILAWLGTSAVVAAPIIRGTWKNPLFTLD